MNETIDIWPKKTPDYVYIYISFAIEPTFASLLAAGLAGKSTSLAFRMVLFSKMAAWVWLWPNGWKTV